MDSAISYDISNDARPGTTTRGPRRRRVTVALRALAALGILTAINPVRAFGQSPQVGDVLEQYMRVLQVGGLIKAGSFFLRPLPNGTVPDSVGPWASHLSAATLYDSGPLQARLDPMRLRLTDNTATPYGQNDDAMWQGKGANFALDAGVTFIMGHLTVTAHPTLVYAQNQPFTLARVTVPGASKYEYPWAGLIDLPQRFGPGAYKRLDPGQSNVSLTLGGAKIGFGTENLWWGPGIQTSILMSNEAPGFPHASLSTSHPLNIGIGTVEGQWIWGRLQQSAWYTGPDTASGRFFTGAEVAFSPAGSFFKGLTVGGGRVFYQNIPTGGLSLSDYLTVIQPPFKQQLATASNPTGGDQRDEILSFHWRWVLPASGFETYGEWARNDFAWNLTDFLLEPEHSQAYTLGLQKVQSLANGRILAVNAELTHMERDGSFQIRSDGSYYIHSIVHRGYTQRGQMIGSALGPGGDGQYVGADVYTGQGRWGLFVQRQVHNNDAFYERYAVSHDSTLAHDVSVTFGGRTMVFTHGLEVDLTAALTKELNRYMELRNGVWNGHAGVTFVWRPR